MESCAKCNQKLDDGLTRCPGCKVSLTKPGAFMEVLGWVLAVISTVPLIVGEKTYLQGEYVPLVVGGLMLVLGIVLVLVGRGSSRAAENPVRQETTP